MCVPFLLGTRMIEDCLITRDAESYDANVDILMSSSRFYSTNQFNCMDLNVTPFSRYRSSK